MPIEKSNEDTYINNEKEKVLKSLIRADNSINSCFSFFIIKFSVSREKESVDS
jgi:hypothetical protein